MQHKRIRDRYAVAPLSRAELEARATHAANALAIKTLGAVHPKAGIPLHIIACANCGAPKTPAPKADGGAVFGIAPLVCTIGCADLPRAVARKLAARLPALLAQYT